MSGNFQRVKGGDTLSWKNFPKDGLVGVYEGCKEVVVRGVPNLVHYIDRKDFWGTATLDRDLGAVKPGTTVKVLYAGRSEEKNKYGNHSHKWDVFQDLTVPIQNVSIQGRPTQGVVGDLAMGDSEEPPVDNEEPPPF